MRLCLSGPGSKRTGSNRPSVDMGPFRNWNGSKTGLAFFGGQVFDPFEISRTTPVNRRRFGPVRFGSERFRYCGRLSVACGILSGIVMRVNRRQVSGIVLPSIMDNTVVLLFRQRLRKCHTNEQDVKK